MSVRPAREADLDAVCAIARESLFAACWSRELYRQEIGSSRSCFVVWEEGGEVLGYLLARRVDVEAQVLDMAVRPQDQGRGVGMSLLEHLAGEARSWGCARITLEVSARNEPAQRLYRKTGYQVVGRRRKFYNDGSDAVLMDRLLA